MTKLAPMTVALVVTLGGTELPIDMVTFDVPLHTRALTSTDDTAHFDVDVNRTELRAHLTRSVRVLADRIEASFLAPDGVLLTCEECGEQLAVLTPSTLHHEADGGHTVAPVATHDTLTSLHTPHPSENPATSPGKDHRQGELSSLPEGLTGGRTCACADRGYGIGDVVVATEISIGAAAHLDATGKDAGAIAALLTLAHKVDDYDAVLDHLLEQIAADPESKIRPPAADNVSLPTYLKYSESLGLTPGGRGELAAGKKPGAAAPDELAAFRNLGRSAG